jgi:hypothetical protein
MMSAASADLGPQDRARGVDTNVGGWPTADARMAGDGDAVVVETPAKPGTVSSNASSWSSRSCMSSAGER